MAKSATITVLFSGGGSLGHVAPSIAVAQELRKRVPNAHTVFVLSPIEEERILTQKSGLECRVLRAPKFPRSVSLAALLFPYHFIIAFLRSLILVQHLKPSVVFSKGGFMSVPVCLAAAVFRVPIIHHCSDSVLNFSDRIITLIAMQVCIGFPSGYSSFIHTGNPVRELLKNASKNRGMTITGFSGKRPVIIIIGGSQGAKAINEIVDEHFSELIDIADIIHITGRGKALSRSHARYFAREVVYDELPHLYALADIVVSRAGAGALSELAALGKPAVIIPLAGVAHDHQCRNAELLQSLRAAIVLSGETASKDLLPSLRELLHSPEQRQKLQDAISKTNPTDAASHIASLILDAVK